MRSIIIIALFCMLLIPTSAFAHKLIPTDGTNIDYVKLYNQSENEPNDGAKRRQFSVQA